MDERPLFLDRRGDVPEPGLHALLIGVSKYLHLPDDPANGDPDYMMASLASPALSAWLLAQRLRQLDDGQDGRRLHRPLKTLRLLVSPSASEDANPLANGLSAWAAKAPATREAVQDALHAWREDAKENRDAVTLFYFGGHGLHNGSNDALLLAADFKVPRWTDFDRALQLSSIRDGMAPTPAFRDIAKNQFYFIDGCRNSNPAMDRIRWIEARRVFQEKLNENDYRSFPTYFAAADGDFAVASAGKPSYFCNALLHGLERGASEPEPRPVGGDGWPIKADSLKMAFDRYSELEGTKEVQLDGQRGADAVLCWLDAPPLVDLRIQLPGDLVAAAKVRLMQDGIERAVSQLNANGLHEMSAPAGIYDVEVTATDGSFAPRRKPYAITQSRKMPWRLEV